MFIWKSEYEKTMEAIVKATVAWTDRFENIQIKTQLLQLHSWMSTPPKSLNIRWYSIFIWLEFVHLHLKLNCAGNFKVFSSFFLKTSLIYAICYRVFRCCLPFDWMLVTHSNPTTMTTIEIWWNFMVIDACFHVGGPRWNADKQKTSTRDVAMAILHHDCMQPA